MLHVTRAGYTITWPTNASIVYGTPLGTNQLDAVASVGGTNYVYGPTNGTILPVGTTNLTVTFYPADTNYPAQGTNASLTVTAAPLVITANDRSKAYNTVLNLGTNAFTVAGLTNGDVVAGVTLSSAGAPNTAPVGDYAITATNAAGGTFNPANYSITYSNGVLHVNPLPVVMFGVRGYDGTTNALAGILQVTNKAGGDVVTVVSGTAGLSGSAIGTWPITSFGTLVLGGAQGTNYTLIGASGWVTITNVAPVTNSADIMVSVTGPATVTVGDAFFYTVTVSNAGPTSAVNTLVTNFMPTNLVFSSASAGGRFSNNIVTWPVITNLANGQSTNFTVTVTSTNGQPTILPTANPFNFIQTNLAPAVGLLTNRVSAFSSTFDPNLTNNSASTAYTNAQVNTLIVPGVLSIFVGTNTYPTNAVSTNTIIPVTSSLFIVGASAWNPVTQLYEEFVSVTNLGTAPIHALRLYVRGLRNGVTLVNATGTNSVGAYVEYDPNPTNPVTPYPAAGSSVSFTLEFYSANGKPFTNTLTAVAVPTPVTQTVGGIQVSNVSLQIPDNRNPSTRYLIQFPTIPGRTYTVLYKDNVLDPWNVAVPSIVASSMSTTWYDTGPPVTLSYPGTSRFYIVLLQP